MENDFISYFVWFMFCSGIAAWVYGVYLLINYYICRITSRNTNSAKLLVEDIN